MPHVLIIVPTFNERENIDALLQGLFALPQSFDVLIVDDHSPDSTATRVQELKATYGDRLCLIVRTEGKAGRGSACMAGFAYARDHGYDTAIEMDGDLSHDPNDIPRLLAELDRGADVAVASKYLPKSRIVGWPLSRYLLSRGANIYVNAVLRVGVSDYTNGFRCYGKRALAVLPDLTIDGVGFTVIPQVTYKLALAGMKIAEIPSVFTNRRHGRSNLGINEIIESLFATLLIRSTNLHRHALQVTKFLITGVVNACFDLLLFAFCIEILSFSIAITGPIVTLIVLVNVFLMNKYWTFRNTDRTHAKQGMKFIIVYTFSFILVNLITWVLAIPLQLWYILARAIAILSCAAWNYLWMHFHVFEGNAKGR